MNLKLTARFFLKNAALRISLAYALMYDPQNLYLVFSKGE